MVTDKRKQYLKEWKKNNKDKVEQHEKTARNKLLNKIHHREYTKIYNKIYYSKKENREKHLKRKRDSASLRQKIITERKCCENCSSTIKLQLHHLDYSENNNIILLCRKCHDNLHKNLNLKAGGKLS